MVLAEPTPGSGVEPVTFIRGDADANGEVNFINDGIYLMTFLNSGGPPPPPPYPEEGVDPTPDSLPCTR